MTLFKYFTSNKDKRFDHVNLQYSWWHWISGNPPWFARVWRLNWIDNIKYGLKSWGDSYGKTKYEALRNAIEDLKKL